MRRAGLGLIAVVIPLGLASGGCPSTTLPQQAAAYQLDIAKACSPLDDQMIAALIASVRTDRATGYTKEYVLSDSLDGCLHDIAPANSQACSVCMTAIIEAVYGE